MNKYMLPKRRLKDINYLKIIEHIQHSEYTVNGMEYRAVEILAAKYKLQIFYTTVLRMEQIVRKGLLAETKWIYEQNIMPGAQGPGVANICKHVDKVYL